MKKILFVLLVVNCLFITLRAQTYLGYAQEMFLFSQPDARSEAMGRGSAVLYGSSFTNFYNPASSSFSRGINAEVSHLEFTFPIGLRGNYDVYGAGVNLGKYGSIAFNYMHSVLDLVFLYTDENSPDILSEHKPESNIFMLNYSRNIINGLSAGVNINCFQDKLGNNEFNSWTYDFGLLKKFSFESEKINHGLYLGLSFTNFTNTKISISRTQYDYLPSILRLAAGYELDPQSKIGDYQIFKALLTTQYMDLLNTDDYSHFQLGAEITLLEILKVRAGYFTMGLNNYGVVGDVKRLNETTYGLGIELPFRKISNVPLNIRFDHTSLPFPTYNVEFPGGKNCPVYSLSMSYDF
ncbi:MAG: hypothetical protein ACM3Q2_09720 [Syntrophothermus sp.]